MFKNPISRRIFRAILFALFLNLAQILEYFSSKGLSHSIFSDWDEPFYLGMLNELSRFPLTSLLDFTNGIPRAFPLAFLYPHIAVDLVLSRLVYFFNLSPIDIGLSLDLICSALGYLIFSKLFSLFTNKQVNAELCTIGFLCFPGAMNIGNSLGLEFSLWPESIIGNHISSLPPKPYICLPILRSAYTQLGLLGFGLTFTWFVQYLFNPQPRLQRLAMIGLSVGLTIYLYFFAWGSLMGICSILLISRAISCKSSWTNRCYLASKECLIFIFFSFLSASIGLFVSTLSDSKTLLSLPTELRGYWYLPIDALILLAFPLLLYFKPTNNSKQKTCYLIMVSCATAELVLNNLQTILGQLITPYHFSIFYLRTLYLGFLLIFLSEIKFHSLVKTLSIIALISGTIVPFRKFYLEALLNQPGETKELIQYLNLNKNAFSYKKTLWSYPQSIDTNSPLAIRLLPYWLNATTDISVKFSSLRAEDYSLVESTKLELFLNWLFINDPKLIAACKYFTIPVPGDLFVGMGTWTKNRRKLKCANNNELSKQFDACIILKKERIDYILWEPENIPAKPLWYSGIMTSLWKSSLGSYEILAVNQAALLDKFCSESPKMLIQPF